MKLTLKQDISQLPAALYRTPQGVIVQVRLRADGGRYAMHLVEGWRFEYAPGALRTLTLSMLLTLEDLARIGQESGVCLICATKLTNPESIRLGIGPVCAKKYRLLIENVPHGN